jgi:hypothetical protein
MTPTPNHGYNVPKEGAEDWHEPLNENFERYDTDIELRDAAANRGDYEPTAGAKFLATDTGVVSVGDGDDWVATLQAGRYAPPTGEDAAGSVAFGGAGNDTEDADGATVGGGADNEASGDGATVAGGEGNEASAAGATVGGGGTNRANAADATIGGGGLNRASSERATVGGGYRNRAGGAAAAVPGGKQNKASGDHSFAAGRLAEAVHDGSFVWNNANGGQRSGGEDQFLVNAVGGVGIGTAPDAPLHVESKDDPALEGDIKVGSSDHRFFVDVQTPGEDYRVTRLLARGDDSTPEQKLVLGAGEDLLTLKNGVSTLRPVTNEALDLGTTIHRFDDVHASVGWFDDLFENSDARLKENVSSLDDGLETISDLRPVTYEWTDSARGTGTRVGLLAQEVEAVLPEVVERVDGEDGDDRLAVEYTKLVPVLIDAVQRQQAGIEERDARIDDLEAAVEEKDARIDDLETRLSALESAVLDDD